MLILSGQLENKKVLSLRSGTEVASVISAIINPNNLKIQGFYVRDSKQKKILILLSQDVREFHAQGIFINDHDDLAEESDLVRLKDVIKIGFTLPGKNVQTASGDKVGRVTNYAFDNSSFFIQKLYVSKPIYRSINGADTLVDRNQITDITPKKIVIEDLLKGVPFSATANVT